MAKTQPQTRFAEYLTVGEAAEVLGVSPGTLRNWDKAGKLKPRRHPQNGYRIYRHADLQAILGPEDPPCEPKGHLAPSFDWSEIGETEHFVQFYENDAFLIDSVSEFIGTGLAAGAGGIVVATRAHRTALQRKLKCRGLDLAGIRESGQCVFLDAAEILSKIMVEGSPDRQRCFDVLGGVVKQVANGRRHVRAFGEMVALLWAEGNKAAAIRLEEIWNDLGKAHSFSLFCGYPIDACAGAAHATPFSDVCACHSRVIPSESYAALSSADERLRAIAQLQQKAHSLEAEIAHRQEVEEALRCRDRRKDEFLATLAHELRNPLAPISNSLHLLHIADDLPPAVEHVREIIERQVHHLVRLVDDLLEVSRITSGKTALRKESVELASVVATAIETSRPLIDAAHHQFAVSLPRDRITLDLDPVRIAQVIANLLNNAAKYTPDGGQIWLTVRQERGEAVVSVRDNGLGIPADMLPRVFDMFAQVDRTLNRAQGGLGIGLSLARSFVEMHGGRIEARSEGHNHGSEFIVHLPLSSDVPRSTVPTTVSRGSTPLPTHRILVVDDTRAAEYVLGKLLKTMGQQVRTAQDAASAMEAVRVERPDIVISDIAMPNMDGYELARRLRQSAEMEGVVLVALTGYGQDSDRQRAKEAGFDYHLVKPVSLEALHDLLAFLPAQHQP